MPMNVEEFDIFSVISWLFFVQISSKIVNFVFSSKMPNYAISFVFAQNEFLMSLQMTPCHVIQLTTSKHQNKNWKSYQESYNLFSGKIWRLWDWGP